MLVFLSTLLYLCLPFEGERVIKRFTVQNISQESLDVSFVFVFVFYKTIDYLADSFKHL